MSKPAPVKTEHELCKSTFTLTFAVELLGIEIWNDAEPGWLELGPSLQGCKIQYQLYPGKVFDIDILIWPNVAKVLYAGQHSWIRTFQFLERKWFTFSINHAFPVRVEMLKESVATVTVSMGLGVVNANMKNALPAEVLVPALEFGEQRYFGRVLEEPESLETLITNIIWKCVVDYIPASPFDYEFDIPQIVKDVRHQGIVIERIRSYILDNGSLESISTVSTDTSEIYSKSKVYALKGNKEKKKSETKIKFEIFLTGNAMLAGVGRVVQFDTVGAAPQDLGEIIVLISTNNLPAPDDYPIVFVNVDNLYEIPLNELKILSVTHLYTRWQIGEEVHDSEPKLISKKINFKDHYAIFFSYDKIKEITASFLDKCFEVQLRGKRVFNEAIIPKLFGYEKRDRDFGISCPPKLVEKNMDFLIATTKIDAKAISKGANSFIRGEYPLFPPRQTASILDREGVCTNDVNAIRASITPPLVVPTDVVLLAQMTLEVNLGFVSCIPRQHNIGFSRMFCLIKDSELVVPLLRCITEANEELVAAEKTSELLAGFALDTGSVIIFFLEGPKDGHILRIWDKTEDFYPKIKPLFSCSTRYSSRLYPDFLLASVTFYVLKMFVPLGVLLACPQVYARPTLPLPTRTALLKIDRLTGYKLDTTPSRSEMPTSGELKSLRLELCVAPRPSYTVNVAPLPEVSRTATNTSRINWEKS